MSYMMNIETLRKICLSFPHATEDIKWKKDLVFSIGEKMFCATGLEGDFAAGFKVRDEEFDELTATEDVIPAPYLARAKWVNVRNADRFTHEEWEHYLRQSYDLVKSKLPKKILDQIGS